MALVIAAQQQLAADQDAEVQAMANYTHAKIAFDDAMGRTLEVNHVSMEEAKSGRVERESSIPAERSRRWQVRRTMVCRLACAGLALAGAAAAAGVHPGGPRAGARSVHIWRPTRPPIRLQNSSRLNGLMRAGNLYLTVADALALAIENNLNLEIDRYGPLLADSALERAKAGGPLRGVPGRKRADRQRGRRCGRQWQHQRARAGRRR